jgi:hypothetical protein
MSKPINAANPSIPSNKLNAFIRTTVKIIEITIPNIGFISNTQRNPRKLIIEKGF